ncbi:hypothetical protein ACFYYY_11795 [Streptomyces sp. NPDC001834]|uniref:hypothetical protein n=1 Tax=Streptomyces sp. NPDC001834 TaxID=3364616 RepID=UPI003683E4A3
MVGEGLGHLHPAVLFFAPTARRRAPRTDRIEGAHADRIEGAHADRIEGAHADRIEGAYADRIRARHTDPDQPPRAVRIRAPG